MVFTIRMVSNLVKKRRVFPPYDTFSRVGSRVLKCLTSQEFREKIGQPLNILGIRKKVFTECFCYSYLEYQVIITPIYEFHHFLYELCMWLPLNVNKFFICLL